MLNSISMPSIFGLLFKQTKPHKIHKSKTHHKGSFYISSKSIFRTTTKEQGTINSLRLHPEAIAVYNLLQSYNYGDNIVYPSFHTMRKQIVISNENLKNTLFFLNDSGLITIQTEKNKNGGREKFKYILKNISDKDIAEIQQKLPEAHKKLKDRKKEKSQKSIKDLELMKKKTNFSSCEVGSFDDKTTFSHTERDKFLPGEQNNNCGNKNNSINCNSSPAENKPVLHSDSKNPEDLALSENSISQSKFVHDPDLDTGLIKLCLNNAVFQSEFNEFCEDDSFSYREDRFYWIMKHASLHKLSLDEVIESLKATNNKVALGQIQNNRITYLIGIFEKKSHNKQAGIEAPGKRKVFQISEYLKTRLGENMSYFVDYKLDLDLKILKFVVSNPGEKDQLFDYCKIIAEDISKRFSINLEAAISA